MNRPLRTIRCRREKSDQCNPAFRFGEPMRKRFFRLVPRALECIESQIDMFRPQIQIEIFCLTRNACVNLHHVRAANQKRNARILQCDHRSAMKAIGFTLVFPGYSLCSHHFHNAIKTHNARMQERDPGSLPIKYRRAPLSKSDRGRQRLRFSWKMAKRPLRIAATADLHYGKHSRGTLHEAFAEISGNADILLLCGDLTDYGLPEEAEALVADIRAAVKIPMLAVLGNHDFESGQAELVCKVLDEAGVNMLDGEAIEVAGVGFAGIAGFGGGFGRRMLNAWGEPLIKQFVQESIRHAVRLEQALSKLQTERRIVLLHYSPIRATLKGEYPEIFAFLGSSRLEEPINRFRVNAVFHGHAHNGILDGKTSTGIPVYNVSAPALRKTGKPYRVVEL